MWSQEDGHVGGNRGEEERLGVPVHAWVSVQHGVNQRLLWTWELRSSHTCMFRYT